jgi:hypothetical protein
MHDFNTPMASTPLPPAPSKARRPWLQLVPPPPGVTFADLREIHLEQLHRAVAKAIGKKGGNFAASIDIDLEHGQSPRPHLVVATTRFRGPYRWEDRIEIAARPCTQAVAAYYATPATPEVARWAFDQNAHGSAYKVVVNKFGSVDTSRTWGSDEDWRIWR